MQNHGDNCFDVDGHAREQWHSYREAERESQTEREHEQWDLQGEEM